MTDAWNGWVDAITSQFVQPRQEKRNAINFFKCSGTINSVVVFSRFNSPNDQTAT